MKTQRLLCSNSTWHNWQCTHPFILRPQFLQFLNLVREIWFKTSGSRNLVRKIWFEKSGSRKVVLQTLIFFSGLRKVIDQKNRWVYIINPPFFNYNMPTRPFLFFYSAGPVVCMYNQNGKQHGLFHNCFVSVGIKHKVIPHSRFGSL